jgi:hypothetical protein
MKYIFSLFALLIFFGCEKEYDSLIDPSLSKYQVLETSSFNYFIITPEQSSATIFVRINSAEDISTIYIDLYSSENKKLNANPIILYDNGNLTENGDSIAGDLIYSNKFNFDSSLPIGQYSVRFYIIDKANTVKLTAVQYFYFNNGKENVPPVISNLTAPDTLHLGSSTVTVKLSIKAEDANGLNDIAMVYFQSYRPDGTTSGNRFQLYDDGGLVAVPSSGDETANDGIFTLVIQMQPNTQKGTWRFEFEAVDRSDALSNKIIHHLVVL